MASPSLPKQTLPDPEDRYYPLNIEIVRESILLDKLNQAIPQSQVMPIYIPKEPIKACVSSPLGQSLVSSRHGSVLFTFSEPDSDNCSMVTQSTNYAASTGVRPKNPSTTTKSQRKQRHKHKKRNKNSEQKAKTRPVNVVGPILSQADPVPSPTANSDREEIFSASGAESYESSEGENSQYQLREQLVAQTKLISKLEEDLSSQIKVNGELKKLLVASVGSDLEYRVEKLAQDKAQLSATVGSYSQKLYKDVEDLDRVSIQADMWRSKYMASRLQTDELTETRSMLTQKYSDAATALQAMLEERQRVNNNLITSQRLLQSLTKSAQSTSINPQDTTVAISEQLLSMCNDLVKGDYSHSSKCQSPNVQHASLDIGRETYSKAESLAYDVLSDQLMMPQKSIEIPHTEEIPRYQSLFCLTKSASKTTTHHPRKCVCKQCSNEVTVV